MIHIGPLEKAWRWFEANHEEVFDMLEIPKETEAEIMFRREAAIRILRNLKMERGPCGRYMERGVFCEEMGILLRSAGYKRPPGEDRFSIKSLKSSDCLCRVWDVSIRLAKGHARWVSDTTSEGLENEPCYEFDADGEKWRSLWENAGGRFYGPNARMIAHKTDQVWQKISRFGLPWPPFDFDQPCSTSLIGISIDEAEEFEGLL